MSAIDREAYTGIALPLPKCAPLIQGFREPRINTKSASIGMHITLVAPFVNGVDITELRLTKLAALFAAADPFDVTLSRFDRFPAVLYLAPEPDGPLHTLANALLRVFPEAQPDFAEHIFHATLAQDPALDLDAAASEFLKEHGALLPIRERIDHAALYEKKDGAWSVRALFPFAM